MIRQPILIVALAVAGALVLGWASYKQTVVRETQYAKCVETCKDSGKSPRLYPLSPTQTSKSGQFDGPGRCECVAQ